MIPRWATEKHAEDVADAERLRRMTPDERLEELAEILALMESILRGRSDRLAELARKEPLPEGWLAIVKRARNAREAG